ncbi:DUF2786 domain-containing protein [Pseudomonas sp.]|uniref:DUF2786 domain-containing protein n=1 Tax=Pseudomonas sp. TaxID=306 RepID=UPI0032427A4E
MGNQERIQAKLRKLLALAERGVGGEKETARRMLETMLKRHGLKLEDLADQQRKIQWFAAKSRFDKKLAAQILAKICNTDNPGVYSSKRNSRLVGVEVTPAEAIEFELHYDVLRKALVEHFDTAYRAFIQANRLFSSLPSDPDEARPTEKDLKVMMMAATTEATQVARRLERGGAAL